MGEMTGGWGEGESERERERERRERKWLLFNAQSNMKVISGRTDKERKLITKNENSVLKQIYANGSYNTLQELS